MQTLKLVVLFGWIAIFSCGQRPARYDKPISGDNAAIADKTQWMSLQAAADSLEKEKRPVLIDLYTDWCGWCKVMDKKTYSNRQVGSYLKEKYYAVKINAESKEAITWNGKTYNFNRNYKANDFAVYLTNGQLSFPTTVIIPVKGEPQAIPGYLTPTELEPIVKYFGEGIDTSKGFETWHQGFKAAW